MTIGACWPDQFDSYWASPHCTIWDRFCDDHHADLPPTQTEAQWQGHAMLNASSMPMDWYWKALPLR